MGTRFCCRSMRELFKLSRNQSWPSLNCVFCDVVWSSVRRTCLNHDRCQWVWAWVQVRAVCVCVSAAAQRSLISSFMQINERALSLLSTLSQNINCIFPYNWIQITSFPRRPSKSLEWLLFIFFFILWLEFIWWFSCFCSPSDITSIIYDTYEVRIQMNWRLIVIFLQAITKWALLVMCFIYSLSSLLCCPLCVCVVLQLRQGQWADLTGDEMGTGRERAEHPVYQLPGVWLSPAGLSLNFPLMKVPRHYFSYRRGY